MNMDAVIGCDAVDASGGWLRLHTAAGPVRTIPWSTIKIAGMGGNHPEDVEIEGVTEKVTRFFATHDSLWIVYGEGDFAQVMIEKSSPKRDTIRATFAQQLDTRWKGDQLDQEELMDGLFKMPASASKKGMPLMVLIVIAMFVVVLLAAVVRTLLHHSS
jgi:hypothetical protein